MKITLRCFGRPRERLGISSECLNIPDGIATLGELLAWLRARDENWASELAEGRIKCAIDQEFADLNTSFKEDSEVAIFSPISGG